MMKFFSTVAVIVVVFSAFCSGQTSEQPSGTDEKAATIAKNREICIQETKVDPNLITRANAGDFSDDPKLKCYIKCHYVKAGMVTEKGELLFDAIKSKLPSHVDKDKALEVVKQCQKPVADPCESVYLLHRCYFEHIHGNGTSTASPEAAPVPPAHPAPAGASPPPSTPSPPAAPAGATKAM